VIGRFFAPKMHLTFDITHEGEKRNARRLGHFFSGQNHFFFVRGADVRIRDTPQTERERARG